MTCTDCGVETSSATFSTDSTGFIVLRCAGCAKKTLAAVEQAEVDALLVAQEQLGRAHACIRDLLRAFEREIAAGYTSPEQQAVAVRARQILETP